MIFNVSAFKVRNVSIVQHKTLAIIIKNDTQIDIVNRPMKRKEEKKSEKKQTRMNMNKAESCYASVWLYTV